MRRRRSGLPPMAGSASYSELRQGHRFPRVTRDSPRVSSPPTTEPADERQDSEQALDTVAVGEPQPVWSCQDLNRPGVSRWEPTGEQPTTENAITRWRQEDLADLADVLAGITFSRVSEWGRPIKVIQPKECYL